MFPVFFLFVLATIMHPYTKQYHGLTSQTLFMTITDDVPSQPITVDALRVWLVILMLTLQLGSCIMWKYGLIGLWPPIPNILKSGAEFFLFSFLVLIC